MQLGKWQTNAIFEAVVAGGLDARECTFDYGDRDARLTHRPSDSYLVLEGDAGHYATTAVVGDSPSWSLEAFTWPTVEERIQRWAADVTRDVETPDLWAQLQREREVFTGVRYEEVENTPFTSDEQVEIAEQVRQIKEFVKTTYSLSEPQLRSLEEKLDDVKAASGRIGRKDWQLLFYGVMFSVIVTGLLPPEAVQHILSMALEGLDHLFGGGHKPPQLPPPQLPPVV